MTTMTPPTRHGRKLATPTVDNWRAYRACTIENAELFFPVGDSALARAQAEQAKQVCRRCPVAEWCLQWALETRQDSGVWGGLSEDDRRRIHRRKRPVYRGGDQTAVDYILENRLDEFQDAAGRGLTVMQIAREIGTNVRTVNSVKARLVEAGALEAVNAA
jgi:hypothetical protein